MDGPLTSDLYDPEGADPGFPVGGGAEPPGDGDTNLRFCQIKKKKLYEIEKSLGHGGHARDAPLLSRNYKSSLFLLPVEISVTDNLFNSEFVIKKERDGIHLEACWDFNRN